MKGPLWKSLTKEEKEVYKQKAQELTASNLEKMKNDTSEAGNDEEETINV